MAQGEQRNYLATDDYHLPLWPTNSALISLVSDQSRQPKACDNPAVRDPPSDEQQTDRVSVELVKAAKHLAPKEATKKLQGDTGTNESC